MEKKEETNFFQVLEKILTKQQINTKEADFFLIELKKLIYFAIVGIDRNQLTYAYPETPDEEILSESLKLIFEKREIILGRFSQNARGLKTYLKTMIKNKVKDKIKKKTLLTSSLEEKQWLKLKDASLKSSSFMIEVEDFINAIDKELTDAEKEALCYQAANLTIENKTKVAFEKAKSRARNRLKDLVKKHRFSEEVVLYGLKILEMSDLCEKFVNMKKEQK